jgi:hypothetical protein
MAGGMVVTSDTTTAGQVQIGIVGKPVSNAYGTDGPLVLITFAVNPAAPASAGTVLDLAAGFDGRPPTVVADPRGAALTLLPAPTNYDFATGAGFQSNVDEWLTITAPADRGSAPADNPVLEVDPVAVGIPVDLPVTPAPTGFAMLAALDAPKPLTLVLDALTGPVGLPSRAPGNDPAATPTAAPAGVPAGTVAGRQATTDAGPRYAAADVTDVGGVPGTGRRTKRD